MPIHLNNKQAGACLAALLALPAWAHQDGDAAIPDTEGAQVRLAAALLSRSASGRLPSQGLPGYLLRGDPGVDRRGGALEHAVVLGGYRWNPRLGAELALGAHGSDPAHVEAAWVQGRGSHGGTDWTLGAGRRGPSLGTVLAQAGHLDRFGLMPLAKHAVLDGDWIEDGAELGLARQAEASGWRLDAGVWRGRAFPGTPGGPAFPSVHAGFNRRTDAGDVAADAFVAALRPDGRGSRLANAPAGHTHAAPVCDASLREVVCFTGRSRVAGLSAEWTSRDWPLLLGGAQMWRQEDGSLQSRNGLGSYAGRTRGGWQQAVWRIAPGWELAARRESLSAQQSLAGPGASLVATEAGLGGYAPQRRFAALLGHAASPWADLRIEWGRERAGAQAARFVALRLVLHWDRSIAPATDAAPAAPADGPPPP